MSNRNNCTILEDYLNKLQNISPKMKENMENIVPKMSRASVLMLLNAILMGFVVVIGAYTPRFRRHPVIGAIFLGITALFLPIMTTAVNTSVTTTDSVHNLISIALQEVYCSSSPHLRLVFLWTGVVVVIVINTSAVVAGDAREGRNVAPPIILLVKASWSAYLTFSTLNPRVTLVQLFVIMFAKLLLKYGAFYMARQSFALGRSPRLIAGYMAQLQLQQPVHDEHTPALIVMGEDKVKVEEQTHGYIILKEMLNHQQGDTARANRKRPLVTLDRVFGLDEDNMGTLQTSSTARHTIPPQPIISVRQRSLKHSINNQQEGRQKPGDLCFSFALFKLLRCRFANYTVSEAGFIQTSKFFRETLLQGDDYERVFGIIRDELSFINDYYFSSLPIYYSHPLLPALGITLSLWSIGYCLWMVGVLVRRTLYLFSYGDPGQIYCWLMRLNTRYCPDRRPTVFERNYLFRTVIGFGSLYYDIVPLYLAIAVLVLAEAREIVSYICSNWTKVALICHHVNEACWQRSRVVKKCICCLLKCRSKLVNNWDDKMKQCSILELRPRKTPLLLRRLLRSLDRGNKVEVPSTVKTAIFKALKVKGESFTIEECHYIGPPSFPVPPSKVYDRSGRPGYTILVWHIATSVFEEFYKQKPSVPEVSQLQQQPPDHKTVATNLSRYCTYLVTSRPELLPDDAEWCRKLYVQVKKDADRVLDKVQGVGHNQLVRELKSADYNNKVLVLKNGAILGEKLVKDSAMGWEKLARFWVDMILFVAPSENLEAHAEAISQGGELITFLWAMLAHAGITGRLDAAAGVVAAAEEGRGSAN